MTHELQNRYRPQTLEEVVGQPDAVRVLADMVARKKVPHTIMFFGQSGAGKTTIGRILRRLIGCSDVDYKEINCAEARGIDDMRDIQQRMGLAPMGMCNGKPGRCRVWLLDEVHSLGKIAQESMLKPLEDTPKHVYFFLCTTDPAKVIATVKGRCTKIEIKPVNVADIAARLKTIADAENLAITDRVLGRAAEVACGSVREAVVLLDKIAGLMDEEEQLSAIAAGDHKAASESIARLLFNRAPWKEVAAAIKALDGDDTQWESIRYGVLGYASAVLCNGGMNDRAFLMIDCFKKDFMYTKKAGLVAAAYEVATSGKGK